MLLLKACPRCHGDLLTNADDDLACLQCGFVQYGTPPLSFVRESREMDGHRSRTHLGSW